LIVFCSSLFGLVATMSWMNERSVDVLLLDWSNYSIYLFDKTSCFAAWSSCSLALFYPVRIWDRGIEVGDDALDGHKHISCAGCSAPPFVTIRP